MVTKTTKNAGETRVTFGRVEEPIELPDLLSIQKTSYDKFIGKGLAGSKKSGLEEVFDEFSPLELTQGEGHNARTRISVTFDKIELDEPELTVEECKRQRKTYSYSVYAYATLVEENEKGKPLEPRSQSVKMCDIPGMTPSGTFVINGVERALVSQLVPSPGVYFEKEEKKDSPSNVYFANIRASRGVGLWFEYDEERNSFNMRPNRRGKTTPLIDFLYMLGYRTSDSIKKEFADCKPLLDVLGTTEISSYKEEKVFLNFHTRMTQTTLNDFGAAKNFWDNVYFSEVNYNLGDVGRYKINKRFKFSDKKKMRVLDKDDIVATIKYLCRLIMKDNDPSVKFDDKNEIELEFDDINFIGNRRVRQSGELMQNVVRTGLGKLKAAISKKTHFGKSERVAVSTKSNALDEALGTADSSKGAQRTEKRVGVLIPKDVLSNTNALQSAINSFFSSSQLSQFLDQNNPLSALAHRRRITVRGPRGERVDAVRGGEKRQVSENVRDVQADQYGRICPIESPEGQNVGVVYALASFARVNEFGFIETPYRVVKNGTVTDEVRYLAEDDEKSEIIAQANEAVDAKGKFAATSILARVAGGEVEDVKAEQITLMDISPRQMVSISTSLIPFLEHDDANRALMGANMQRQAVPLVRTEAPFVGTGSEYRAAVDSGDVIIAQSAGVVAEVHSDICRIKGDNGRYTEYHARKFSRTNAAVCANNAWLVREGDTVKAGQPLADGPGTKDGELAIGKNLLVAFMNWEGYNYEDAIIISSRIVQDDVLSSIHIAEFEISAEKTSLGDEEITRDIPKVSLEALANLDENGIINVGSKVKTGDILVGKVTPKAPSAASEVADIIFADTSLFGIDYKNTSLKVPSGVHGTVIHVEEVEKDRNDISSGSTLKTVRVQVAVKSKLGPGDKLSGRHGNKGVVSVVLPVEDMPFLEDGTPVDIILNPLGVPGRMNIGQILETHLGWVAKQGWDISRDKGKDQEWKKELPKGAEVVPANTRVATPVFDGLSQNAIRGLLRSANPDQDGRQLVKETGKATLIDGRTGEPFAQDITVGYMYILKLHHLVDEKVHARSTGSNLRFNKQPRGGRANFGGQRLGEMEVWALEAYGAAHTLQEMLTVKSDDVRGSFQARRSIQNGRNIEPLGLPESFKILGRLLLALGLNVDHGDDQRNLFYETRRSRSASIPGGNAGATSLSNLTLN